MMRVIEWHNAYALEKDNKIIALGFRTKEDALHAAWVVAHDKNEKTFLKLNDKDEVVVS